MKSHKTFTPKIVLKRCCVIIFARSFGALVGDEMQMRIYYQYTLLLLFRLTYEHM